MTTRGSIFLLVFSGGHHNCALSNKLLSQKSEMLVVYKTRDASIL